MRTITVQSCAELEDALFVLPVPAPRGRLRTHQHILRGVPQADYPLTTNLQRLGAEADRCEYHLIRNFEKYATGIYPRPSSVWHWLALAQHHGLPTRLMDWTASPFVAMHFATGDSASAAHDGAIWAVDFVEVHKKLPSDFLNVLEEVGSNVFSVEMISQVVPTLAALTNRRTPEFVLFLEPPSIDERIVNQFSLFSLPSCCRIDLATLIGNIGATVTKFTIPAALKPHIRARLDQANITERTLFPGLDGISAWLRRRYSFVGAPDKTEPSVPRTEPNSRLQPARAKPKASMVGRSARS